MTELYEDWRWFKDYGVLPEPGGRLDQPGRFCEAVDIIEQELARLGPRKPTDGPKQ